MNRDNDVKAITRKFFAAYNAHDVDGMLALCADGAQGRYLPYGKNSVMPFHGGLEKIWRGFPKAVPDIGIEIIEMISGKENTIVVQALVGGTMPADVAGLVKIRRGWTYRPRLHHPLQQRRKNLAPRLLLGQRRYQRHKGKRLVSDSGETQ